MPIFSNEKVPETINPACNYIDIHIPLYPAKTPLKAIINFPNYAHNGISLVYNLLIERPTGG